MTNGPACEPTSKLRASQRTQDSEEISTVCFFRDDAFRVTVLDFKPVLDPILFEQRNRALENILQRTVIVNRRRVQVLNDAQKRYLDLHRSSQPRTIFNGGPCPFICIRSD